MTTNKVLYFQLGRQAFVSALKLLNIGLGDLVLIPSLICDDVLSAIETVGAKPMFYEVDEHLRPSLLPHDARVKAVLAVNYFGFAQDLQTFNEYCRISGATLIEDNAHGSLSADPDGNLLGSRAPLGFTSIRKTLRIADGAQLSINDPSLVGLAPQQLAFISRRQPFRVQILNLFRTMQSITGIHFLDIARIIVRKKRTFTTGSPLPKTLNGHDTIVPGAPLSSSIATIMHMDSEKESARRRKLFTSVTDLVLKSNAKPIFEELPNHCVPYGYPFWGDLETASHVGKLLRHLHLEVIQWPQLPKEVSDNCPIHYKQLWVVNFL